MSRLPRVCHALPLAAAIALLATACRDDLSGPEPSADRALAATAAAPPSLVQVSGGATHTCGITAAGQAWCWGSGDNGQLGTGDAAERRVPTPVAGSLIFRRISAGGFYTCGVTTDDRIWCWGANFNGALGDGTLERRFLPVRVAGDLRWQTVSAGFGSGHTCALTTDRVAYCWGFNGNGELGDGSRTGRLIPVAVKGGRTWREISAGYTHTCAITPGRVAYCWGLDESGQLGDDPDEKLRVVPRPVAGGLAFDRIGAGHRHTCGVTTAGRAYCWGQGGEAQIGDGKLQNRYVPTAVASSQIFRRISAVGVNHTCAEAATGRVYCWGLNAAGEVGDGTTERRTRPVRVATDLVFAQMAAGGSHTCAVTSAKAAYCWGHNGSGELGDGSFALFRTRPVPVAGGS